MGHEGERHPSWWQMDRARLDGWAGLGKHGVPGEGAPVSTAACWGSELGEGQAFRSHVPAISLSLGLSLMLT